jgi:hypothetical protein
VVGKWRPLSILGTDARSDTSTILDFQTATSFEASGGCNSLIGPYRLEPDGTFHVDLDTTTETRIACVGGGSDGAVKAVIRLTTKVAFVGPYLVMLAADGHEVARYARVPGTPCVLSNTPVGMPTPERLTTTRVFGNGSVRLLPPAAGAVPAVSAASIWSDPAPVANGSHYEIVLALYSALYPASHSVNGHEVPDYRRVLAWVVIGHHVPMTYRGPGPDPGPQCGVDIRGYNARTGAGFGDLGFGSPE